MAGEQRKGTGRQRSAGAGVPFFPSLAGPKHRGCGHRRAVSGKLILCFKFICSLK